MKVGFNVKYGYNEIEIPVNEGKLYYDNAPSGLSDLNGQTFTLINQIPQAPNVATKVRWHKYKLQNSDKKDGIYDRSSGTMVYKANSFTAYLQDWQHYKAPMWLDGGFYAMADVDKQGYYTANTGDLLIFADIPDETPTTITEFTALTQKYKDIGGLISGVNVCINYKPNGEPWKTNHIEVIKG